MPTLHAVEEHAEGALARFARVQEGDLGRVRSPKLREAYKERYWPADLRPVLAQLPRKSGTPRFLIVRDGKIVSNEFGTGGWAPTVADLKKELGE